jgi:epoxyqueuosine reductase QueG
MGTAKDPRLSGSKTASAIAYEPKPEKRRASMNGKLQIAKPVGDTQKRRGFESDPKQFIENTILDYVATSPSNRLESFDGAPIYEPPIFGYADGDDPIFEQFKEVVHKDHFTPREILGKYLSEVRRIEAPVIGQISVVSFALPYNRETMRINALEKEGPALRWNHTRWKGQEFNHELVKHVIAVLESIGVVAVAPDLTPFYRIVRPPEPLASTWSHRHMAFAAGLGTFSLNDGFITPKGIGVRCNSFVINAKLEPSVRPYADHLANCTFYATGKCGACISRCPGNAISKEGHDKLKCYKVLHVQQKPWLDGEHGPGYIGTYAGCGLCQTGVPCATRIPASQDSEESRFAVRAGL